MTTDDVRQLALALPETAEGTHSRLPSVQVAGKDIVVLRKRNETALVLVAESDALAAVAEDPGMFEEERRSGKLRGVWVKLAAVKSERLQDLVERAWRDKAPKELVAEHDAT